MSVSNDRRDSSATDPLTALRLQVFEQGYQPLPVISPDAKHNSAGKAVVLIGWKAFPFGPDAIRRWRVDQRAKDPNTGIRTGKGAAPFDHLAFVGVDIDVPVPELAENCARLAAELLGHTPLCRIGKAPKSLLVFRTAEPLRKMETPELFLPDGTKVQVEVLGDGQQFVAYGTHPATRQPYTWPEKAPHDVPLAEVPEVSGEALRAFLAAAEAILRAAGGLTEKERETAQKPPPAAEQTTPGVPPKAGAGAAGGEFFKAVNRRALDNIEPWFRGLFAGAEYQPGTGAWRASAAELKRDLEEDLSMHPAEGGQDFGTRKSCSPIDVVMQWGGAPTPQDAAFWGHRTICERSYAKPPWLGTEPERRVAA